ncbi:hypothetical protein BC936DRAFT_148419 [Jimgerdemannia flammicorona]|uniref:Chromatin modification-related protein n=1 Tax=Jimgerdemannia flammicorona TaxID=994334 RepID=A0A433DL04_9FUNG|nr:hypothetical protein BC936DRAFT_148419 [Jimgerdemannia flammicorona]
MKPSSAARQADNLVYLDDYIDTVEALPLELQRNFTLMRELDGYAQELMEVVATESVGFIDNVRNMSFDERLTKLKQLGSLLSETLKRGEEKVALAKSTYDTVDRHCTRLDTDLQKFEDEQMIGPGRISTQVSGGASGRKEDAGGASGEKKGKGNLEKKEKETRGEKRAANERKIANKDAGSPPLAPGRSGTPKDSKTTKGGSDKEKTGSTAPGIASSKTANAGGSGNSSTGTKNKSKEKGTEKEKSVSGGGSGGRADEGYGGSGGGNGGGGGSGKEKGGKGKATAITADMPIDPNEPLYCYCQQVSYGEMVACDNEDCEIEWFHIACVDLKTVPKGKWFCSNCHGKMKGKQKK